ncbi:hypothetical protein UlMin_033159 [Ulmus minor]
MPFQYRQNLKTSSQSFQGIFANSIVASSINLRLPDNRLVPQLGCVQSLLPLHSAVSSAQLTSCMGIDSNSSRLLSQGTLSSANLGV